MLLFKWLPIHFKIGFISFEIVIVKGNLRRKRSKNVLKCDKCTALIFANADIYNLTKYLENILDVVFLKQKLSRLLGRVD